MEPPPRQQGLDLRPLFENPKNGEKRSVVSEMLYKDGDAFQLRRMVRTGNYKLITNQKDTSGDILFDLSSDPDEKVDISTDHPMVIKRCLREFEGLKNPDEVSVNQALRAKEIELLKEWESAAGVDDPERWKGNPASARDYPAVQ